MRKSIVLYKIIEQTKLNGRMIKMAASFNNLPSRIGTKSFKWDKSLEFFGREDVIPLWVADMDFPCAKEISDALIERAKHPVYGYTVREDGYISAFLDWMRRRHELVAEREWLTFSPPGIIYAIWQLIQIMTEPGDGIIVPTPDYASFYDVVNGTGRKLIYSPMIMSDKGEYALNIEHIEEQVKNGAKAFIFSSPNNPTGRVFHRTELEPLLRLSEKYGLLILSDEIYADFVFSGNKHLPIHTVLPSANDKVVALYAVNKCFNLGGLQMSTVIIPSDELRKKYNEAMYTAQTRLDNVFGTIAFEQAYKYGEEWLEQTIEYVAGNRVLVEDMLRSIPEIKVCPAESSFLMWLDCRSLGLDLCGLKDFFMNKAGLAPTFGDEFGPLGDGFVRINIACSKTLLEQAMVQLLEAIKSLNK